MRQRFGFAERGRKLNIAVEGKVYDGPSLSVTCTTDLTRASGLVISNPREQSNSATDFLDHVLDLIAGGV